MSAADTRELELVVDGMTCASCVSRVEKRLNRLDGVSATVNLATERAHVTFPAGLDPAELIAAVERAGYSATVRPDRAAPHDQALRRRLIASALLTVPVLVMAMVPAARPPGSDVLSLLLGAPVVAFGGWPFHRTAAAGARHGTMTMDTLISLGTLVAFGWSVYAVLTGAGHSYVEVATVVTTFVLSGRYAEARTRRRAGSALRALLTLGAKDVGVLRDGREVRLEVSRLGVGDLFVVRPGERIATDGVVEAGGPPSTPRC